jgi:hypothetical protein
MPLTFQIIFIMEPNTPIGLQLILVTFAINGALWPFLDEDQIKRFSLKEEVIIANQLWHNRKYDQT